MIFVFHLSWTLLRPSVTLPVLSQVDHPEDGRLMKNYVYEIQNRRTHEEVREHREEESEPTEEPDRDRREN